FRAEALGEIVTLEKLRYRVLSREADDAFGAELVRPFGVVEDLRLFRVEDLEHLLLVGTRVLLDLLARQGRARLVLARRVADHAGEVADQELHLVAEPLEVAQLVDHHGMAQMEVRRGRIEPELDAELASARELFPQLVLDDQLLRPPTDGLDGLLNGRHVRFAPRGGFARLRRLLNNKGF